MSLFIVKFAPMDKQSAAKLLYYDDWPQSRIAEALDVSPNTISRWAKKDNWDDKRQNHFLARETASENIMQLISYQLKVLSKIKDQYEKQIDSIEDIQELNKTLINTGQIDALSKLFSTVKQKEITWAEYVKVIREFLEHLHIVNNKLSKEVSEYADDFLNTKRKDL